MHGQKTSNHNLAWTVRTTKVATVKSRKESLDRDAIKINIAATQNVILYFQKLTAWNELYQMQYTTAFTIEMLR
jgi:hypothetical protein